MREDGLGVMVKSAAATVTEMVVVCVLVPPEDVIVTWYVPTGVPCRDVTVRVESTLPPDVGVTIP